MNPFLFRPMAELAHEGDVELALNTGQVVKGRMLKGVVSPASRQYLRWHTPTPADPRPSGWVDATAIAVAWRDYPSADSIAAWKELAAA